MLRGGVSLTGYMPFSKFVSKDASYFLFSQRSFNPLILVSTLRLQLNGPRDSNFIRLVSERQYRSVSVERSLNSYHPLNECQPMSLAADGAINEHHPYK